jgi:hypothetical protein
MSTTCLDFRELAAEQPPLDEISTRWTQVKDPAQFVLRYSAAIRAYLLALLKDEHDADDVSQDFVLSFLQRGLTAADPDRGRFRDYLKVAVRRAAWAHERKAARRPQAASPLRDPVDPRADSEADRQWQDEWRKCLLQRAARGIERHMRKHPGCGYDVALSIAREHSELDSPARAALAAQMLGRPVSPAAFRQMLRRARSLLRDLLVEEVSKTLRDPTPSAIEEELADLELLGLLRDRDSDC